jgi:hypothetical protein
MIHAVAAGLGVALVPEQLKKTRTRECGVPATESHGRDRRLCRMEERESIGCSASVRADRRASGPEHPLGKRHAVAAFPTIADLRKPELRESPNPVCAHSIPSSPFKVLPRAFIKVRAIEEERASTRSCLRASKTKLKLDRERTLH